MSKTQLTEVIKVRVTPETKAKLAEMASAVGTSRSSVMRQLVHITHPHIVKAVAPTGGDSGE